MKRLLLITLAYTVLVLPFVLTIIVAGQLSQPERPVLLDAPHNIEKKFESFC